MGLVAVQEYKLPPGGSLCLALGLQGEGTFLDIQKQETVKGFPGQMVAGQVCKMPTL